MLLVSRRSWLAGRDARTELYRGQGNDPFWHGVFGGLYLPHLREASYYHLLQAEGRIPSASEWQAGDAEADGQVVVARRDACFGLQVKPSRGGALTEIDYYPQGRNLTDVLSRRPEAYHQRREAGATGSGASTSWARPCRLKPSACSDTTGIRAGAAWIISSIPTRPRPSSRARPTLSRVISSTNPTTGRSSETACS